MPELDVLIRSNPKAEKQEASLRAALEALRNLQESGIHSAGYELVSPYGAVRTTSVEAAKTVRMRYSR